MDIFFTDLTLVTNTFNIFHYFFFVRVAQEKEVMTEGMIGGKSEIIMINFVVIEKQVNSLK